MGIISSIMKAFKKAADDVEQDNNEKKELELKLSQPDTIDGHVDTILDHKRECKRRKEQKKIREELLNL